MKLSIKIIIIAFLLLSLSGCSNVGYSITTENVGYSITTENENWYLIPNDSLSRVSTPKTLNMNAFGIIMSITGDEIANPIKFSSIEEMANDIWNGNFTEDEFRLIAEFPRDDFQRIPICNPEILYIPTCPDTYSKYHIIWYGQRYFAIVESADQTQTASFIIVEKEPWENKINSLQNYKEELASRNYVSDLRIEEDEQNNRTVYSYSDDDDSIADSKICIYSFQKTGTTFYIMEFYELSVSDKIPNVIHIYGTANELYFLFEISEPISPPSVDWLAEFGIEKYTHPSS